MTLALTLVRWLHLSASILLASLLFFEAAIVIPATRQLLAKNLLDTIRRRSCRAASWTLFVALLSWFVWSWLVASTMSGDPLTECLLGGDWLTVLTGTQFGYLWLFRMTVGLLLGLLLRLPGSIPGRRIFFQPTLTGLSAIELVSLAGAGHGTASPGPFGIVHLLNDALHLLASAFWPGTLVPLAALLLLLLKSNQPEAIRLAAPVVRRFSAGSLMAVTGMALTGLVNTIFMVGSFQALLSSVYGQILISKLLLFFGMIGFGAWNLLLLKPRIVVDIPAVDFAQQKGAVSALLKNVLWEIGLGTAIILIVGWLGITPPPRR